ncbi:MAG: MIP family channel protein [Verrucomicrobiales bacterium]|nr:MIP family channel protein [Verrucomicrobiales bacterium]
MNRLFNCLLGECVGTFILVFFGCGSVAAAVLTGAQVGIFQVAIVWGLGIAIAIYLTGSLSGAHLNPAVTTSLAWWVGFPKRRVLPYIAAQLTGAFLAAAVLYLIFSGALRSYETAHDIQRGAPGSEATAMVFGEYFPNPGGKPLDEPRRQMMAPAAAFGAEVVGTAILLLVICSVTDKCNRSRPRAFEPVAIGLTVTLLISLLGPLTMACFNPARDLGPRVFSALAGWGALPFSVNGTGWLTVYVIAPLLGGLVGGGLYHLVFREAYRLQTRASAPSPATIAVPIPALKSSTTHNPMTTTTPIPAPPSPPARYFMIGGFLGAGKTTAVAALAQRLAKDGMKVGLITNDQGSNLVDTAMLRARGFATEEIPGGCFCCRFNSLVDAAAKLTAATRPDAFVAEPVGSCTDLVATVTYPLRRIYGDRFRIAPLSVLLDPIRAEQVFGLGPAKRFSEKVLYIWRKQAEEADLLVITKTDLLDESRLNRLKNRLGEEFPGKEILTVSARTGEGIDAWFDRLLSGEQVTRPVMAVDYDVYAEGEALLGWLNATVQVRGAGFDANALLRHLAGDVCQRLAPAEIAHLKMTFSPDQGLGDIAAVSLVRSDYVPELSFTLDGPADSGQLILNLRAEADPAELRAAVEAALAAAPQDVPGISLTLDHSEQFRPGRPNPTHRYSDADVAPA